MKSSGVTSGKVRAAERWNAEENSLAWQEGEGFNRERMGWEGDGIFGLRKRGFSGGGSLLEP